MLSWYSFSCYCFVTTVLKLSCVLIFLALPLRVHVIVNACHQLVFCIHFFLKIELLKR